MASQVVDHPFRNDKAEAHRHDDHGDGQAVGRGSAEQSLLNRRWQRAIGLTGKILRYGPECLQSKTLERHLPST
jgi:hypothetical protein